MSADMKFLVVTISPMRRIVRGLLKDRLQQL